jgi:hypothetical protein
MSNPEWFRLAYLMDLFVNSKAEQSAPLGEVSLKAKRHSRTVTSPFEWICNQLFK